MYEIIGYFWSQSEDAQCVTCGLRTIRTARRSAPQNGIAPTLRTGSADDDDAATDTPNPIHEGEIAWSDGIRCDTCGVRIGWENIRPPAFEDLWMRRMLRRAEAHTENRA